MPGATLPTNWIPDHAPTALELAQVLNAITRITNITVFASAGGCTLSTTSASYVDITSATTSWTKTAAGSGSTILFAIALDIYPTVAGSTVAMLGVNIGGTDTDVKTATLSTSGTIGGTHMGFATIASVAAGAYTVKLRAKRTSGSGTLTVDSLCNVSFLVGEIPL